jgi:hypothetical protein
MIYSIVSLGNSKKIALLIISLFIVVASCTKDQTLLSDQESASEEEMEEVVDNTDTTTANNDSTTNDNSTDDETFPTTGKIIFDQDFILNETRSFVNYVLPDLEYNKFLEGEGSVSMITEKAYEYLEDNFDYIIILSVEAVKPPDLFYGRATPVQNQIQGLGISTYDNSASFGSDGKLKSIIYMPRTEYISNGPFLHEIAHTFANKGIIPSTVPGHWGFASTAGQLGGFEEFEDLGNNTYRGKLNGQTGFGTFANGGNSIIYGDLELYAMGLIGADQLAPIQVAVNPEWTQTAGEFTADAITTYIVQDLINEHGVRLPAVADSQKAFKALTVVISKEVISEVKTNAITTRLENFSRQGNPDTNWGSLKNFWLATQEKATFEFTVAQESLKQGD